MIAVRPWQLFALAPGRQIDAQPLDLNVTDVHRGMQKAAIAGAEGETTHRKRRHAGLDVVWVDGQVFS